MAEKQFPSVAEYPLPAAQLRAPIGTSAPNADADARRDMTPYDTDDLYDAMTTRISAAIARKARQRRYTP